MHEVLLIPLPLAEQAFKLVNPVVNCFSALSFSLLFAYLGLDDSEDSEDGTENSCFAFTFFFNVHKLLIVAHHIFLLSQHVFNISMKGFCCITMASGWTDIMPA